MRYMQHHQAFVLLSSSLKIQMDSYYVFTLDKPFHAQVFLKCGSTTRTRFADITGIAEDVCRALPGLYAFTGCDTVSAMPGRGKIGPLKMVMQSKESFATFEELGEEWQVQAQLFQKLCTFTCHIYTTSPGTDDVSELRY